jgi:hypothetical protein
MFGCEVVSGMRDGRLCAVLDEATKALIWRILTLFRAAFTIKRYSVSDASVH